MIATPAFGYVLKREFDAQGNRIGSRWLIDEAEAVVVRDIFERRARGESMHEIARELNKSGVPTRRKARTADGGVLASRRRPQSALELHLQGGFHLERFDYRQGTCQERRA